MTNPGLPTPAAFNCPRPRHHLGSHGNAHGTAAITAEQADEVDNFLNALDFFERDTLSVLRCANVAPTTSGPTAKCANWVGTLLRPGPLRDATKLEKGNLAAMLSGPAQTELIELRFAAGRFMYGRLGPVIGLERLREGDPQQVAPIVHNLPTPVGRFLLGRLRPDDSPDGQKAFLAYLEASGEPVRVKNRDLGQRYVALLAEGTSRRLPSTLPTWCPAHGNGLVPRRILLNDPPKKVLWIAHRISAEC